MACNMNTAPAELPSAGGLALKQATIQYGKPIRDLFLIDPDYLNLNHGSYGSIPRAIQKRLRSYQDAIEARPDAFVRYEYEGMLDKNRQAAATLLGAPLDAIVLVPNVTTAINVVLRNLTWNADGRDEILYFTTIYGACNRTIDYVVDTRGYGHGQGPVHSRAINIEYPIEDDAVVAQFRSTVAASEAAGRRARVCVFDVVSSVPGVRFPFEQMVKACRELGVTSVVDGAQGIGMIPLHLAELDPDYFFTNCHKWLYSPRGSAVLYVPTRHQHTIQATMPVSHSYTPKSKRPADGDHSGRGGLAKMFEWVGTVDSSPLLCVDDAIRWRAEVLGGEEAIMKYLVSLAREGGKELAAVLGTEVLDNSTHTATACALTNVRLPLQVAEEGDSTPGAIPWKDAPLVAGWMMKTFVYDYNTCIVVYAYRKQMWLRLSAQVYLDVDDFKRAGEAVLKLCERVREGEPLK